MKKKARSLLLTLALCLSLLPTAALAAEGDVTYRYCDANGENWDTGIKHDGEYTLVTSETTTWGTDGTETWYVAQNTVEISGRVTVAGEVHLILTDGCTLTAISGGIGVDSGNMLTIYGQSESSGTLTAQSKSSGAGIGGSGGSTCGTITINGGNVTATGNSCSAGIGGGGASNSAGGAGGKITINGGTVTAIGGGAAIDRAIGGAGIGGGGVASNSGSTGGAGGTITINGGTVIAMGGKYAAGIGGGAGDNYGTGGAGGTITISGGDVTAAGHSGGAGIGGGSINSSVGSGGDGGTITISGGNVNATGNGTGGAGIGGGAGKGSSNGTGGSGGAISISGGSVIATGGTYAAGIGGGGAYNGNGIGGNGGNITISGGTVTATGGGGGDYNGTGGAGIGGAGSRSGTNGGSGTFQTTASGNAVVFASSISDQSNQGDWRGIIFEDNSGAIYGTSVTPEEDFEIPSGKTLTIASGQTLTVPAGKTLTNNGILTINGTVTNNGTLTNNGTITGSGTLTPKLTQAAPAAPTVQSVTATSITLQEVTGGVDGVHYSSDGTSWQASTYFSGLTPATQYTFYARYKSNGFYNPSAASSVTAYTAYATPAAGVGYSIDYIQETINFDDTKYEVNENYYFDGKNVVSGSSVRPPSNFWIRRKASDGIPASEARDLRIPRRPEAPASSVCTINYSAETLTFDSDLYEVNTQADFTGTAVISGSTKVTPANNLYVRQKAVARTSFASPATTVQIPARNGYTLVINNTTESVTIPRGYCYNTTSADYSGVWSEGNDSAVTVDPGSIIYIYKAATENEFKSVVRTLTAPSRSAKPNVTIDYSAETLSTTAEMQYSTDGGASWTDCTANMAATDFGWNGSAQVTVQFRVKATGTNYASEAQTVPIPPRAATPSPSAVAETVDGKNDGQFTGLIPGTVYQINVGGWQDKTADENGMITGLAPGFYQVRVKATDSAFASDSSYFVQIRAGVPKTYTLNITSTHTFADAVYGDAQPAAQDITIQSSGNWESTIASVTVDSTDFIIAGSDYTVTAGGSIDTWTVQPAAGLAAGAHTATITVTYNNSATATAEVSFTVTKAAQAAPDAPTVKSKTYSSVTLEEIPDNTNGAKAQYSKDGGTTWQDSPEFTGLSANTEYSFVARYGETDNYFASPASDPVVVTTNNVPVSTYPPTVEQPEGGSVTTSTKNPTAGSKVTITATPDAGYEVDRVIVTDRNGNPVEVTDNGDGTYSFTQPSGKVTITVTFKETESEPEKDPVKDCQHDGACPTSKFTDVKMDWTHDGIHFCVENGLMQGEGDGRFNPEGQSARAMLVTVLYRLEGEPEVGENGFNDVPKGEWYTDAVTWAAENKIVEGYDGKFDPTGDITREQFATILYRYAKYKSYDVSVGEDTNILSYTDAGEINSWAVEAMQWAVGAGLINGKGNNVLDPTGEATRAEMAAILYRFCENVVE